MSGTVFLQDSSITLEKAGLIAPDFSPEEENKADGQKTVLTEQKPSAGIFSPEYFSCCLPHIFGVDALIAAGRKSVINP